MLTHSQTAANLHSHTTLANLRNYPQLHFMTTSSRDLIANGVITSDLTPFYAQPG